jgi:hypothetical protein
MVIVPGRLEVAKAIVSAQSDHDDHAPPVLGRQDGGRAGVDARGARFLDERFVGSDAGIVAVGLHARDADREPASGRKNDRRAAGTMVDEGVSFAIFVWT